MNKKLIIFDCDGTLVDSQHLIVSAMNSAFEAENLLPPTREETLAIVGLSLPQAFHKIASGYSLDIQKQLAEQYKAAYRIFIAMPEQVEPLYAGISTLIKQLHANGHTLGVATGKSRMGLVRVLKDHNLTDYFSTLQTADDAQSKPHPEMLERAASETGFTTKNIVMIGDTTFDIQMARNANAQAIGVTWGYHSKAQLLHAGAHAIAHSMQELSQILNQDA